MTGWGTSGYLGAAPPDDAGQDVENSYPLSAVVILASAIIVLVKCCGVFPESGTYAVAGPVPDISVNAKERSSGKS